MNRLRDSALILSAVLCIAVGHVYFWRADWYAGMTIWPVWLWLLPGLVLILSGWNKERRWFAGAVVLLWFGCLLAFSEDLRSLFRARHSQAQGQSIRVVSLNCVGNVAAADELAPYHPDFVLLQESPPARDAVDALAVTLFGKEATVVWTPDASILARAPSVSLELPHSVRAVGVRARLPSGRDVAVVSLRLSPHLMWADGWSPKWWRDHIDVARDQRRELKTILDVVGRTAATESLIIGGDFNAPAGDSVYRLLSPRLRDSYREGGVGWGNTLLNDFPVWRIDQVWVSKQFRVTTVVARKTVNSDHRMVICDLQE